MRVWLREDRPPAAGWSVPVALDGDRPSGRCRPCTAEAAAPAMTMVVVSVRGKTYRDASGDMHWEWVDYERPAVVTILGSRPGVRGQPTVNRAEVDDASGQSVVTAEATIGWSADLPAFVETAEVTVDGVRWSTVESWPLPGAVGVRLERIDDAG